MEEEEITPNSLILSATRGLLCEIRPKMRQVSISYDEKEETVSLYIYYNEPLTQDEENYDISGTIMTEIISLYPQAVDLYWDEHNIVLPYPAKIPEEGICVYKRFEPPLDTDK